MGFNSGFKGLIKVEEAEHNKYFENIYFLSNVIRTIGEKHSAAILKFACLVTVSLAVKTNLIKRAVLCLQLLQVHCSSRELHKCADNQVVTTGSKNGNLFWVCLMEYTPTGIKIRIQLKFVDKAKCHRDLFPRSFVSKFKCMNIEV